NPELLSGWLEHLYQGQWETSHAIDGRFGWGLLGLFCLLYFPQLTLGLSGFEMSLILMPQVQAKAEDKVARLRLRIRNTRKALVAAAVTMSIFLLGSVLVTALLIPPAALREGGPAANRALAYLAHGGDLTVAGTLLGPRFGVVFGTLYDL